MRRKSENKESGIALISVLCMILVASIMVASAVAISQFAALESNTFSGFSRSFYIAEGAAARVRWLINADRRQNPQRTVKTDEVELEENERYLADNVVHKLDYYGREINFQIEDTMSGIDISGSSPDIGLKAIFRRQLGEEGGINDEEFAEFCSRLHDYTDSNDLLSINGMEKNAYTELNLYNLPRNNKLQYVQEMTYIPGFSDFFTPDKYGRLSIFKLIPPEKMSRAKGRPNLFSSPLELIAAKCSFNEEETEQVADALKKWQDYRTPLEESLDPGIKNRLLTHFSIVESGFYTLVIRTSGKSTPGTTLICSYQYISAAQKIMEYHQFTFY